MFSPVAHRAPFCRGVLVQIIERISFGHTGVHDGRAVARFIQIIRDTARRARALGQRQLLWGQADVVCHILRHIGIEHAALVGQRRYAGCCAGRNSHRAVGTVTNQGGPGRRAPAVRGRDTPACVLRVKDDRPCRCRAHVYQQRARAAAALGKDNVSAFIRCGSGCWRWS